MPIERHRPADARTRHFEDVRGLPEIGDGIERFGHQTAQAGRLVESEARITVDHQTNGAVLSGGGHDHVLEVVASLSRRSVTSSTILSGGGTGMVSGLLVQL